MPQSSVPVDRPSNAVDREQPRKDYEYAAIRTKFAGAAAQVRDSHLNQPPTYENEAVVSDIPSPAPLNLKTAT